MTSATALICYPPLSLSLSFFLSLSPSSQEIYLQAQRAKIFEHGVRVALAAKSVFL